MCQRLFQDASRTQLLSGIQSVHGEGVHCCVLSLQAAVCLAADVDIASYSIMFLDPISPVFHSFDWPSSQILVRLGGTCGTRLQRLGRATDLSDLRLALLSLL